MAFDVGSAVNGADAKGPCCDLTRARALSSRPGHTESWTNLSSDFLEALCCHPTLRLAWFWLLLTAWGTVRQLIPWWGNQPCVGQCPLTLDDGLETRDRVVSLQLSDHQPCGPRVSLFDHSEGICPACPVCSGSHLPILNRQLTVTGWRTHALPPEARSSPLWRHTWRGGETQTGYR